MAFWEFVSTTKNSVTRNCFKTKYVQQEMCNSIWLFVIFTVDYFFRLMLAMDPKYGEISRAMRNRGVEIYILGEVINQNCHSYILDFNSHVFSRYVIFNYCCLKSEHYSVNVSLLKRVCFIIFTQLESFFIISTRQQSCGNVMFSEECNILFVGCGRDGVSLWSHFLSGCLVPCSFLGGNMVSVQRGGLCAKGVSVRWRLPGTDI